ncbi:unnamed protein product [Dibothriocephalus latus]|uniref:acid phosphatase n=1 Tax=Dibothriocephalus latus TaxID=60516 RepID=A0A3P7LWL3_DIBLA|nr:unnamed protein product [Dibothriocephalus latus]
MHLLFRHGDRTPIETFPNDGHQFNTTWPEGAGQLTQLGIEQQYLLGTWIRETYNYFIPRQYHASIFHMRSTDFDRTLMSAMANLAGLFRHSNSSLEKYNIHWRPIPVHTVKQTSEIMFASAPCPRFKQLLEESYKSDETKAFFDKHKTLFDLLRKESGWPELGAHNFWIIEDDLICLEAHNFSLPQWYTPAVKEEVGVVSEYLWKLRYSDTERLRLELGVFINDMIEHLDRVINPSASSPAQPVLSSRINAGHTAPKIMAYSAHDENVAALLSALGPPADPSAYHIRVRYKRSWQDPNGQYLSLPACTSSTASEGCEYNKLVEYLQPLRLQPDDFESACRTKIHRHSLFLFFGVAAFGLLLAFCGLVSTCVLVSRRRRHLQYETFTNELAF